MLGLKSLEVVIMYSQLVNEKLLSKKKEKKEKRIGEYVAETRSQLLLSCLAPWFVIPATRIEFLLIPV